MKGKITDPRHLKLGGDLDQPYGTFVFKTIYTDEGQEFGKQHTPHQIWTHDR